MRHSRILSRSWSDLARKPVRPSSGRWRNLLRQSGSLSVVMRNPRMNQAVAAYFAGNRKSPQREGSQCDAAPGRSCMRRTGSDWSMRLVPRICILCPARHRYSCNFIPLDSRRLEAADRSFSITLTQQRARTATIASETMPRVGERLCRGTTTPLPTFFQRTCSHQCLSLPAARLSTAGSQSDSGAETVPARLCHLSGNRAVFVAADDGATSLIIDTSEMGHAVVRRAPADELEPGHYLLLRTAGGGDFIAPLADRILGDSAAKRRSEQAEWKERLISRAVGAIRCD